MESQNESTDELMQKLENDPRVEYIEPNYRRSIEAIPDDPLFSRQWGLKNITQEGADIHALDAWDTAHDSSAIVAVLDTGVNYQHPDLAANMWDGSVICKNNDDGEITDGCPNHGWDFANNDSDPQDDHGHGTHVAGIIGAQGNNERGIAGVNWNAKIRQKVVRKIWRHRLLLF